MGITRKKMLDALASQGFRDPASIENVTKFLAAKAAEGVEFSIGDVQLSDENGPNEANVKSAWATMEPVTLRLDDADAKASGSDPDAALDAYRKARAGAGANAPQAPAIHGSDSFSAAKKAYSAKIAMGGNPAVNGAVWGDADAAEYFGAYARLAVSNVAKGAPAYRHRDNDISIVGKVGLIGNNETGGFLVPSEFVPTLLYLSEAYGSARALCNVQPMSRDVMRLPIVTDVKGMTAAGVDGATAGMTASDTGLGAVEVTARQWYRYQLFSNALFEDSAVNVGDVFARTAAEAYAYTMDNVVFNGDGTSTYNNFVGILNALPTGAALDGAGNTWSALTGANFDVCQGSVQMVNSARLAFACSRQFYYQVMQRLDNATSQFRELASGSANQRIFKGDRVQFTQVLPVTTAVSTKSCVFGDFMGAVTIGERRDLTIAASDQVAFNADSVAYRATCRFGANVHGDKRTNSTIGSTTIGPLVTLATTS